MYTPHKVIAAHDYGDAMHRVMDNNLDPMKWASNGMTPEFNRFLYDHSVQRVSALLAFPEAEKDLVGLSLLTNYGLGNKRSLDQLIEFTGIDTRTKEVFGDRCKELQWVPFAPDKDPSTIDGDVWGFAPEVLPKGGANVPILSTGSVELVPESQFSESVASILERRRRAVEANAIAVESGESLEVLPESGGEKSNLRARANELESAALAMGEQGARKFGELEQEVEEVFRHRGKELWWVFQSVDTAVESLMNHIDQEVGMGHGHRVSSDAICDVLLRGVF